MVIGREIHAGSYIGVHPDLRGDAALVAPDPATPWSAPPDDGRRSVTKNHESGQHIHHSFDKELETLKNQMLQMGKLVEEQLAHVLDALIDGDASKAQRAIDDDQQINTLETDIDEACIWIFARRQPVAGDLRFVMAVAKVVTDLERMGDEAVRIARMALRFTQGAGSPQLSVQVHHLGLHVRQMLRNALDAFDRVDIDLSVAVVEEDRRVDAEYEQLVRSLIKNMMADPASIPRTLEVQWAARALERIGDRACNICEYVIYFDLGRDVRHLSFDQIRGKIDHETIEDGA